MSNPHVSQLGMEHIMGSMTDSPAPKKRGRPRKHPVPDGEPVGYGMKGFAELEIAALGKENVEPSPIYPFHRATEDQGNTLLGVLKREYERQRATRDEAQAKMDYLDGLVAQCPEMQLNK